MTVQIRQVGSTEWLEPNITSYDSEASLQAILADSPRLLPGAKPLVVVREFSIPGVGLIDLVGVAPDASIVLVECKLGKNSEIKRSIVGQVLAYAGGLWETPVDEFEPRFDARLGGSLIDAIASKAETEWNEDEFRSALAANLAAGSFQLVLAVDSITEELRRVVEFLNGHTRPDVGVLALELGYASDHGVELLLPQLYGEEAVRRKAAPGGTSWTPETFFAVLDEQADTAVAHAVRQLVDHHRRRGLSIYWGKGQSPAFSAYYDVQGKTASVWTVRLEDSDAHLTVNFGSFATPLNSSERAALLRAFEQVVVLNPMLQGVAAAGFNKYPTVSIRALLVQEGAVDAFTSVVDGFLGLKSDAVDDLRTQD